MGIYDIRSNSVVHKDKIHESFIKDIHVSDKFIITSGYDKKIKIFDQSKRSLLFERESSQKSRGIYYD